MYRQRFPDDPGMHNSYNPESYTRVSYRENPGFCERVKQSLVAVIVGFVLLFVASGLLFWNEGRAVQTAKSLDEGLNIIVELHTTEVAFDNNNGNLVFLQGTLDTDQAVSDPVYKISVSAVKLRRTVEMYQWVEYESKREIDEGEGHTREEIDYSYAIEWRQELVRSSSFYSTIGHENPSSMPATSETLTAREVKVGAFYLSEGLINQIDDFQPVEPSSGVTPADPSLNYLSGFYFHAADPAHPRVGDIRVKFEAAGLLQETFIGQPTQVSIVARQQGNQLESYPTEAGDDLEILHTELISGKEIFVRAHSRNTLMTWAIRFGGWFLMFIGFGCLTSIITTLVDWLPVVRELVAMGLGALNAAFSISLSLTVIALGWIRYRPWLGMTILVMSVTPFLFSKLRIMFSPSSSSRHRNV